MQYQFKLPLSIYIYIHIYTALENKFSEEMMTSFMRYVNEEKKNMLLLQTKTQKSSGPPADGKKD